MNVRELVQQLLELPDLNMEVLRSGGEDPKANIVITQVTIDTSYNNNPEWYGGDPTFEGVVLR